MSSGSSVSRGFSEAVYVSSSSFWFAWVRRVHSGSSKFTPVRLDVLGFALVHSGGHNERWVHSGSRGFTRARVGSSGSFAFV